MAKATPAKPSQPKPSGKPTPQEIVDNLEPGDLDILRETLRLAETAATEADKGPPVRVYHLNRSSGSFIHGEHRLDPGGSADVPQSVADLWLGHTDGTGKPHVALSEAAVQKPSAADEAEKARLAEELEASKGENAGLNERIAALEVALEAAKKATTTPPPV